jgi:hypothetical protein
MSNYASKNHVSEFEYFVDEVRRMKNNSAVLTIDNVRV